MRLSIACAATDAEFQDRIILHDNTLNLHVVARQPDPKELRATHGGAPPRRCLKGLNRHASPRIQERLGPQLVFSPAWQWPYLKSFWIFQPPFP